MQLASLPETQQGQNVLSRQPVLLPRRRRLTGELVTVKWGSPPYPWDSTRGAMPADGHVAQHNPTLSNGQGPQRWYSWYSGLQPVVSLLAIIASR